MGSLSVVSEARVSKLHTRARCVCALSIQRLEGRRWRLRRMRVKGPDLTAMGIQSSRSSVSCWFCGTWKMGRGENRNSMRYAGA
jgi:hypothetical protein